MTNEIESIIIEKAKQINFTGVIGLDYGGEYFEYADGFRDRANKIKSNINTRFGIASGTKGFTALGITNLIEKKEISVDTKVISILGNRIKNLNEKIIVGDLLCHKSGMGDYVDEDEINDINEFTLPIPIQNLKSASDYIPLLEEKEQKFIPGSQSIYCNSGYIVLSLIIPKRYSSAPL